MIQLNDSGRTWVNTDNITMVSVVYRAPPDEDHPWHTGDLRVDDFHLFYSDDTEKGRDRRMLTDMQHLTGDEDCKLKEQT